MAVFFTLLSYHTVLPVSPPEVHRESTAVFFLKFFSKNFELKKMCIPLAGVPGSPFAAGWAVPVSVAVEPAGKFWRAETYHQNYYFMQGKTPYCHRPVKRFGE